MIGADGAIREPDLGRLRLAVDRANRSYQAARYDEAGRMLPGLIRSVETAARTCPRRDAMAAGALRSQVYQTAATVLGRVGETGLAWNAGDRAVTTAEHADAGLLAAVSAFRLAHVFIKRKHASQARDLVAGAASALQRSAVDDNPQHLSVLGALHLADVLAVRPKRRSFPGRPDQVARARDFTRRTLGACPVIEEAVLLVSELVTNGLTTRPPASAAVSM